MLIHCICFLNKRHKKFVLRQAMTAACSPYVCFNIHYTLAVIQIIIKLFIMLCYSSPINVLYVQSLGMY